ncbi:MAG: NAD(P)-dependent oxidoreductase [Chloroflexota bacterium]
MTTVGITGAAGGIGSMLVDGLGGQYELTLFDVDNEVKQKYGDAHKTVVADLSDEEAIGGLFDGLDVVIHLAASASDRSPWERVLPHNIVATYNVFEEARRADVKRIVFASSNHCQNGIAMADTSTSLTPFYERHRGYIRLDDPPTPTSIYGVSKLFGENLGWLYHKRHGIQFVGLRIGATGPSDNVGRSKGTDRESYMRAMFLSRRDCIEVFKRAIEVDTEYLITYAISDNDDRIFDMKETMEKLSFYPQDNSKDFFDRA